MSDVEPFSFGTTSGVVEMVSLVGSVHGDEPIFAPNPNEFN